MKWASFVVAIVLIPLLGLGMHPRTREAQEELVYNCCLEDPCDRCALDHQSCSCSKDLKAGKGVCSDCYAGWQTGQGKDIPGMTKEKVKANFHGHKH
jgi:hypothetical protein